MVIEFVKLSRFGKKASFQSQDDMHKGLGPPMQSTNHI